MSLMEGIVLPIQLDILTCHAVVSEEQSLFVFVLCVGALLSLICACATCNCTTKGHPRPLSCQQG